MHHTNQNSTFKFDIFDLLHLDDLDLTQRNERLTRVPEVSQTPSMPLHQLCLSLTRLLCPAKPVMTDRNMSFYPTCDVISDRQIKCNNIFRTFKPGAIKCRFRIENWSRSMADSAGGRNGPLIGGHGPEIPIGARVT